MRFTTKPRTFLLLLLLAAFCASPAWATTSRLYGEFGYHDSDGNYHPAVYMNFDVRKPASTLGGEIIFPEEIIGSFATDADGRFDIEVLWDYVPATPFFQETTLHIDMKSELGDQLTSVRKRDSGSVYSWTLYPSWNSDHTLALYGSETPGTEEENFLVHLLVQTREAVIAIYNNWGEDLGGITVLYPDSTVSTGGEYFSGGYLSLPESSLWRDDHLLRLLGHRWNEAFGSRPTYDLCDGTCDDSATLCSFCDWCAESPEAAWSEGFALFFADEVTRWLQLSNPKPSLMLHDFETLGLCYGLTYATPELTPGNVAALLLDLIDPISTADFNSEYPGFDAVGGLLGDVRYLVSNEIPTSAQDFLTKLHAMRPNLAHDLWLTARANGFETDVTAPSITTALTSSSHGIGSSSADNTADFSWNLASDDISGVQGYAISISSAPVLPPAALTVGNVTSYTSPALAPGTYYMSIRSVDWADNWSPVHVDWGPFTILNPTALDLDYDVRTGWDYISFPSQGATNTSGSAHVNSVMVGDAVLSRWNLAMENLGPAATTANTYVHTYVDDELMDGDHFWSPMSAGTTRMALNEGLYMVRGGRHNFHTVIDGQGLITETDEANNIHGRQFIWTGAQLTAGTTITRSAPPNRLAGAEHIPGAWYSCDGLSFDSSGWWNAVVVRPQSDVDNYECRLHYRSTGSEDGFAINEAYSTRPAGTLDGLFVNRNTVGDVAWDVGVLNPASGGADYTATLETSLLINYGSSSTIAMTPDRMLILREVYVAETDTGYVSISVDIGTAPDPVTMLWLDKDFQIGTLLNYDVIAVTDGDGQVRLDLHVPLSGYYCLALYREAYDVAATVDVQLSVGATPADLTPYQAAGWHEPLVPSPADDGTFTTVNAPATLLGNDPSTYFNFATTNQGYLDVSQAHLEVEIDGDALFGVTYPLMPAGAQYLTNNPNPFTVRGGRHTITLLTDPIDTVVEMDETNNNFGRQYIWQALTVPFGTGVTRAAPPVRTGGWAEANVSWYNCDGLHMNSPGAGSFWTATAVMPTDAEDNPDVRLHLPSGGTTSGFSTNVATSNWGVGQSDYVLANFNVTGTAPLDVGVIAGVSGVNNDYRAETVQSTYMGNTVDEIRGPFTSGADEILQLYEWNAGPGVYHIVLENLSGTVDWGMSVHVLDQAYQDKSDVLPNGSSWLNGPGGREYLTFTIPTASYFCLAVWKRGSDDLPLSGDYQIRLETTVTAVDDDQIVPQVTRLQGAVPNPFNPTTKIAYTLAQSSHVSLSIYDLTGARIVDLVDANQTSGAQEAAWSGTDPSGRALASGVYMARLVVDGRFAGMTKLSLVK